MGANGGNTCRSPQAHLNISVLVRGVYGDDRDIGWTSMQVGCESGDACPPHTWWRTRQWPADYDRCRAFATVHGAASFGCVRAYDHVTYRVNVTVQYTHTGDVCR